MWTTFLITILSLLVLLFCPGYLAFRGINAPRVSSFVLAPPVSIAVLLATCFAVNQLDILCSWLSVGVPSILICAIPLCIRIARGVNNTPPPFAMPIRWSHVAFYLVAAAIAGIYILLLPLGDPTKFIQEIDNYSHLGYLREYLESGSWPLFANGSYPCGWHIVGATSASLLGTDVVLTENAVIYVFASFVFPMSMLAFMGSFASGEPKAITYGAIIAPAFAAYPWGIISFGPLFPNTAGFALLPALAALFIKTIEAFLSSRHRTPSCTCCICALFACACMHPNTVFFAIVLLTPYCIKQIYNLSVLQSSMVKRISACSIFAILVFAVWYGLYTAPFMQGVVTNNWASYNTATQSLFDLVIMRMTNLSHQLLLGFFVIIGICIALRKTQYRWLAFSYLIIGTIFIIDTATEGPVKQILAGFWYTDPCRISACVTITAVPLAALGVSAIDRLIRQATPKLEANSKYGIVLTTAIACLFILAIFAPQRALGGYRYSDFFAFDNLRMNLFADTNGTETIYSEDERAFAREAKDLVGDALVINSADDGSLFAYGADGLNTYYRTPSFLMSDLPEKGEVESDESWAIRYKLPEYAQNKDVQSAVKSIGAEYVIQLDADNSSEQQRKLLGYTDKKWSGIDAINAKTPGFEIVLQDGDMKLFRIVSPAG